MSRRTPGPFPLCPLQMVDGMARASQDFDLRLSAVCQGTPGSLLVLSLAVFDDMAQALQDYVCSWLFTAFSVCVVVHRALS